MPKSCGFTDPSPGFLETNQPAPLNLFSCSCHLFISITQLRFFVPWPLTKKCAQQLSRHHTLYHIVKALASAASLTRPCRTRCLTTHTRRGTFSTDEPALRCRPVSFGTPTNTSQGSGTMAPTFCTGKWSSECRGFVISMQSLLGSRVQLRFWLKKRCCGPKTLQRREYPGRQQY